MNRTIDLLGIRFRVEYVECVSKEDNRLGEINYLTNTIRIDRTLPVDASNQVLMHEILHGLFTLLGYDELSEDESKVQGIATALHLLFSTQDVFLSEEESNDDNDDSV